jgi:hypothetical protein
MPALVTNNASATLATGITAVATTITLGTGQGALFPSPLGTSIFYATLVNSSNQAEVVKVTARATDTLTVVRGQDSTTARAYSTGDKLELRPTAALFNAKLDADTAALTYAPLGGTGASGTWPISVTGNAATSSSCTGNAATSSSCSGNSTTATTASALNTANNYQGNSFGVGTAASGTAGEIRATNNITAYYSDERLKDVLGPIVDALAAVNTLSGVRYKANAVAGSFGYNTERVEVGVLAQEVAAVLPEVVVPAPFDIAQADDGTEFSLSGQGYLTVHYERIVPLLIEAIKELSAKVAVLENK